MQCQCLKSHLLLKPTSCSPSVAQYLVSCAETSLRCHWKVSVYLLIVGSLKLSVVSSNLSSMAFPTVLLAHVGCHGWLENVIMYLFLLMRHNSLAGIRLMRHRVAVLCRTFVVSDRQRCYVCCRCWLMVLAGLYSSAVVLSDLMLAGHRRSSIYEDDQAFVRGVSCRSL